MAASSNHKGSTSTQKRRTNTNRSTNRTSYNRKQSNNYKNNSKKNDNNDRIEILAILLFAFSFFLFLCNFGIAGSFGNVIKHIMFGLFGIVAYVLPFILFAVIIMYMVNKKSHIVRKKIISALCLVYAFSMLFELVSFDLNITTNNLILTLYNMSSNELRGGGLLAGLLTYFLYHYLAKAGTILVIIVLMIISFILLTGKSFVKGVASGTEKVYESAKREQARRKIEREEQKSEDMEADEQTYYETMAQSVKTPLPQKEEPDIQPKKRIEKKVFGVMEDTKIEIPEKEKNEIGGENLHEIIITSDTEPPVAYEEDIPVPIVKDYNSIDQIPEPKGIISPINKSTMLREENNEIHKQKEVFAPTLNHNQNEQNHQNQSVTEIKQSRPAKKYVLPPTSLLKKPETTVTGDSPQQLKETALRLQQTLEIFGVKVTITDISKGPAVTRYEVQPELGVKVSKIVALADDIKLNLAATDIRIEAPIPGKAAVGIEVPNKENTAVYLREMLEAAEFKKNTSNIAFAVGKDLAGQTIVTDIAKMLHVLIAGATGSGKSVCINTLIMSILYKANPEDVKFIMIDPKVVELSVFNGIPHLLYPVVTDPKKAAGALHWGVEEMTRRYKVFADYNVKDLAHYNSKVDEMKKNHEVPELPKMPQIIIIVDELADLMMAAQQSVEESICRLAQLARAAGIHLIIATQRPSVDVITGLIKANMPSRIAFSVASGVDSRTILDMNGAEKLLGKGDMLFYPQGMNKPTRIQGAFVTDKEVVDVVDFIKSQDIIIEPHDDLRKQVDDYGDNNSTGGFSDNSNDVDSYFEEAGKYIIDKEKASIGMLQRAFKIGFNRAARIMDQLCEAGVVSEEESTKPRNVLMSLEQFENYISENL